MHAAIKHVYVAASSAEIARAERVIATLRAAGCVITHAWPEVMRANPPDAEMTDAKLLPELRTDIDIGVGEAVHVLFLAPTTPSTGFYVELGAAYAFGMARQGLGLPANSLHIAGPGPHAWCRALGDFFYTDDDADIAGILGARR